MAAEQTITIALDVSPSMDKHNFVLVFANNAEEIVQVKIIRTQLHRYDVYIESVLLPNNKIGHIQRYTGPHATQHMWIPFYNGGQTTQHPMPGIRFAVEWLCAIWYKIRLAENEIKKQRANGHDAEGNQELSGM